MATQVVTTLAIIVPVLNEAAAITSLLTRLAPLRTRGTEVIVVDGGSNDDTCARALPMSDRVIAVARGRANQMNAGARIASADVLLFLHADTCLPADADRLIANVCAHGAVWGRFDVRIDGLSPWLPVIAALMNCRSRLTAIATGDQAIFVQRNVFEAIGGFADIPLMEDIELSKRLRRHARPACLGEKVTTSGRRWDTHGVWRTIGLMWQLRLRYFLGADPRTLAIAYGYSSNPANQPADKR